MTGFKSKLSAKQQQAIAELLVQPSLAEVARATGVKLHVLQRWLKTDREFQVAYLKAKRAAHRQCRRRLLPVETGPYEACRQILPRDMRAIDKPPQTLINRPFQTSGFAHLDYLYSEAVRPGETGGSETWRRPREYAQGKF